MNYSSKTSLTARILFSIAALTSFAVGQQVSRTLSLSEVVSIAGKQNVDVMVARLRVLESGQATVEAKAALLPQVSLTTQDFVTRFNVQSISGGDQIAALKYQVIQGGSSFSQVVFDMGAVRRLQAASQSETTMKSNEETVEQTVYRGVITQYLGVIRNGADLERTKARLKLAERLELEAEHLQSAGVGTSIDVLRARFQLESERQHVIDAEAGLKISKQQLIELLQLPPEQEIDVAQIGDPNTLESNSSGDVEAALRDRSEEAAAKSEVRHTDLQEKAASAQRLPVIQFNGFIDQQGRTWGGMIPAYTYMGTVTLPIFTGGRIRAEIRSAELEKRRAVEVQHGVEAAISYQTIAARTHLDASKNSLLVAKRATDLAQQELVQAEHRFNVGVANNIELITAQQSLATADANEIASDYLYKEAVVDLYRAVGKVGEFGAKP